MSSVFEDALQDASAAVDAAFADEEGWLYQPFTAAGGDVNARPVADTDRAATPIDGVFINPYARGFSGPARHQGLKPEHPGHASARPQIDFDKGQLGYAPRRGDRVTRNRTGEVFVLGEIKYPDAGPRLQMDLTLFKPGNGP